VFFAVLALAYFVTIAIALFVAPTAYVVPDWIWPDQEKQGAYIQMTLTLALIAPAFYELIFLIERPWALLIAAGAIPLLILTVGIFKLKSRNSWIRWAIFGCGGVGLLVLVESQSWSSLIFLWIAVCLAFLSNNRLEERLGKKATFSYRSS